MEDELGRKIMTEFVGLIKNLLLIDNGSDDKKAKGTKKCHKKKFENYKNCLEGT